MSHQLDKTYDPKKYESKLYQAWESSGAFTPEGNAHLRAYADAADPQQLRGQVGSEPGSDGESRTEALKVLRGQVADEMPGSTSTANESYQNVRRMRSESADEADRRQLTPFTIVMPPPNANGNLHMGHAMFVIEDIMIRYRRMLGHPTLWLPGADHAGIETQVVYERVLAAQGKSRFDLGREEFYRQVDAFTKENMGNMIAQVKSLGFSVDWSRLQYTLDDKIVATVYDTFKELHEAGLVYRSNRIVNWCPSCRSSFADIEVKYRDQTDPLYFIKYGPFVLATVRPETKFGDTAIAVHPDDERYAHLIGTTIEAEDLLGAVHLQVIGDRHIDPAFGTGAMKVTPAHDPSDWEIGQRHGLEVRQVIGTDGLLTKLTGKYAGMPVQEARVQVARDLEARGLMDHVEMDYRHAVGYHDRCGTQIEPLTTLQWWLKVDELKRPAIAAITSGEVRFVPERFTKAAVDWLENLHDWNISRQNWWGIRVPVFYNATTDASLPEYIIGTEADAKSTYGLGGYEAETDNFDTWFSSGQWPFATLMATGDFERGFYPNAVMETGRDILYLWVTRMIMFGLFKTKSAEHPEGQVPFRTVYLHGLITDEHGKKMSKSKGNVLNPLEMTDTYGTDAVRLALTIGITAGNDGPLSERKIEGYRNFCNKLWNVARFILGQLPDDYSPISGSQNGSVAALPLRSAADYWIARKLDATTQNVTAAIEEYRFSEAGQQIYALLWDDFADWYLEASKISPNHPLLIHVLETILKLAHPIAPFVTEAIWSEMPWHKQTMLITTAWPAVDTTRTPGELSADLMAQEFERLRDVVMKARTVIAEEQLSKPIVITTSHNLMAQAELLQRLGRIGGVEYAEQGSGLYLGSSTPAWIKADAQLIDARKHRLQAQLTEKQTYARSLTAKLANSSYVDNAPTAVVADTRERLIEAQKLAERLSEQLHDLS